MLGTAHNVVEHPPGRIGAPLRELGTVAYFLGTFTDPTGYEPPFQQSL